jgi:hypothetical protein
MAWGMQDNAKISPGAKMSAPKKSGYWRMIASFYGQDILDPDFKLVDGEGFGQDAHSRH